MKRLVRRCWIAEVAPREKKKKKKVIESARLCRASQNREEVEYARSVHDEVTVLSSVSSDVQRNQGSSRPAHLAARGRINGCGSQSPLDEADAEKGASTGPATDDGRTVSLNGDT